MKFSNKGKKKEERKEKAESDFGVIRGAIPHM